MRTYIIKKSHVFSDVRKYVIELLIISYCRHCFQRTAGNESQRQTDD
jgi:hypothetical protein